MYTVCALCILLSSVTLMIFHEWISGILFFILSIFFIKYSLENKSITKITIDENIIFIEYFENFRKYNIEFKKNEIQNFEVLYESFETKGIWINTDISIVTDSASYKICDYKRNFDLFEFLCKNAQNIPNYKQNYKTEIKFGLGSKESLEYYSQNLKYSDTVNREQKDTKLALKIILVLFLIILIPLIVNIIMSFLQYYLR